MWQQWMAGLNRTIYVLGLTSLFTDVSTEMLVPIRFIFLVRWLGTPLAIAALIEGLAESASSLLKVAVGRRADRVKRRTPMLLCGYSLSNLAKPAIGFVLTWQPAMVLLLLDRIGKAIRVAPRDAMIADSAPAAQRGKAFGFHRAMDTLGAACGPLITVMILELAHGDMSAVFRWTIIPGLLAVLVILLFLREPRHRAAADEQAMQAPDIGAMVTTPLGHRFWVFTAIWTLFSLGNSSDAFIFLRSLDLDATLVRVPLYYAGLNAIYALFAMPLGALTDRIGRLPLLIFSCAIFAAVYTGWGLARHPWQLAVLFLLYGLYYAATEGVARAYVVDLIPAGRRGSALGWFLALTGLAALPANLLASYLWTHVSQSAPFFYGAMLAGIAAGLLWATQTWRGATVRESTS